MFKYIAEYYKIGLYTETDLDIFVAANMISLQEKQEIINENKM